MSAMALKSRYARRRAFSEQVLCGTSPAMTARLRMSYRVAFASTVLARTAVEFGLSPRESQAMILRLKGIENARIAEALGLTLGTVQVMFKNIYRKMNVGCIEQAVVKWFMATGLMLRPEDRALLETEPYAEEITRAVAGEEGMDHST